MKKGVISLKSSAYIVNPEKTINDAIEREDWFSGFSNSVSYFEYFGYKKLDSYCKSKGMALSGELKRMNIRALTLTLYITELINQNTFGKMRKTIKERNKLIHPIGSDAGIAYRDAKEKRRAKKLLNDAKYCIKKLG